MENCVTVHDQQTTSQSASLQEELLAGLRATPKTIPPKFFYDWKGSELFNLICEQPEYYPTRTEEAILHGFSKDIARLIGDDGILIELGSGASRKIRLLLEAMRPVSYLGIDISRDFLIESTQRLAADYPWLEVHAACADFSQPLQIPGAVRGKRPVAFFPGSSIGNFSPLDAEGFLNELGSLLPPGSGLLIGVDLIKDEAILNAAYNDAKGVTAAFNLNLLNRLCKEFDAVVDPDSFSHRAFYNVEQSRIEMHLVSKVSQSITVSGESFDFEEGETLHTENSYKYSVDGFQALALRGGFHPRALWTDPENLFSIHYLERV
ncbi:L-histidine N(alpha)-methyltransferase [Halomonas sp. PR-M31]|uniref:L-histidine N(alpha)-methyltransferase n=1 Tax=Halomonas sp. PR-M31 TaxID=1471202 RepID=UPI000651A98B|nr:L-histidine N(alpha)-methyltransferase [Halomonas sp. PR-M31]